MKILIVGAGEVGKHIAARLVREGHDLVVIDRDPDRISKINDLDLLGHEHDGCNPEALAELGIAKAGLLFAVSNDDTTNILAAITARALGVQRCVVRVSARHHYSNPLLADENITLIDPEELVAQEIKGMMRVPGAVRARFFKQDRLVLLHLLLGEQSADLCGRALRDLDWPGDWKLVALRRGTRIEIPTGDTQLEPGCRLYVVGRSDRIDEILAYSRVESRRAQRVVIAGGGQVGQRLAGLLDDMDIDVTVLQRSRERAELLAGALPRASVLCGDMTDPELLAEAGVGEADYFVAATGDDQTTSAEAVAAAAPPRGLGRLGGGRWRLGWALEGR